MASSFDKLGAFQAAGEQVGLPAGSSLETITQRLGELRAAGVLNFARSPAEGGLVVGRGGLVNIEPRRSTGQRRLRGALTVAAVMYGAYQLAGAAGAAGASSGAAAGGATAAELEALALTSSGTSAGVAAGTALGTAATTGAATMSISSMLRSAAQSALTGVASNFISGFIGQPVNIPGTSVNTGAGGLAGQMNAAFGFPAPASSWNERPGIVSSFPGMPGVSEAGIGGSVATIGRQLLGVGGTAMRVAAGLVRTAAGKIRGVMLGTGRFVSSKKAVALAKRVGLDTAAVALGISAVEMAQMVLDDSSAPRRGKGISAAQMRTTRRTMRAVMGLHRQLVAACSSARVPIRRRVVASGKRCR